MFDVIRSQWSLLLQVKYISITYRLQMMKNKFSLKYKPRFHSSVGRFLDLLSYIFTYPWIVTTSLTISTFLSLSPDTRPVWRYTVDKALLGPALLILSLVLTPFAVSGFCLWIFICTLLPSDQFSSVVLSNQLEKDQENFSFATMNVLLGQEALGKFNNASLVYSRMKKIAAAILAQDERHLINMEPSNDDNIKISKADTVLSNFPRLDFICLQEVFDRIHALALISMLRQEYKHFTFDIGDSSIKSNFFLLNSGLMIASRYPILSVRFHPFTWKNTFWQRCISYGVVICKVDLGSGDVGIIANLHTMAYEDQDPLIDAALTEVGQAIDQFRYLFCTFDNTFEIINNSMIYKY